jgi:hypothetical protein
MGYSVGRWEGDVLVVESNGYTDRSWLDFSGHPHTSAARAEDDRLGLDGERPR